MLGGRKESESYEAWKKIKWKESRCTNSDVPLERGRSPFPSWFCQVWIFPGPDKLTPMHISHPTQSPPQGGHELFEKNSCKWTSAGAQRIKIGVISPKPDFHIWDSYPMFAPFRVNRGTVLLWSEPAELPTLGRHTLKKYFSFLPAKKAQKHLPWDLDHEEVQKPVSLEPVCQQISYTSWLENSFGCGSLNFSVL